MIINEIFLRIANLANDQDLPLTEFVAKLEEQYKFDKTSLPTNEDGDKVYPDGRVSLDLDISDNEALYINKFAAEQGITVSVLVSRILEDKIQEMQSSNNE